MKARLYSALNADDEAEMAIRDKMLTYLDRNGFKTGDLSSIDWDEVEEALQQIPFDKYTEGCQECHAL